MGSGRWMTSDGRFGVFRRVIATTPMEVTGKWKTEMAYSIHDFRGYNGPKEFIELAPEVGRVSSYREAFPWLGEYTGEGSFEVGVPGRAEPKPVGGVRKVQEASEILQIVFQDALVLGDGGD